MLIVNLMCHQNVKFSCKMAVQNTASYRMFVFSPTFVADTKISFRNNFVAPLKAENGTFDFMTFKEKNHGRVGWGNLGQWDIITFNFRWVTFWVTLDFR